MSEFDKVKELIQFMFFNEQHSVRDFQNLNNEIDRLQKLFEGNNDEQ